jgi:hypothetical protein
MFSRLQESNPYLNSSFLIEEKQFCSNSVYPSFTPYYLYIKLFDRNNAPKTKTL